LVQGKIGLNPVHFSNMDGRPRPIKLQVNTVHYGIVTLAQNNMHQPMNGSCIIV